MKNDYDFYLAPGQETCGHLVGMTGFEVEAHLRDAGLVERVYSPPDDVVTVWVENPSTYPQDFKGKAISLWGSVVGVGDLRSVRCLIWDGDRAVETYRPLSSDWYRNCPTLLKPM